MSERLQPALLGGLLIGFLTALPVVNCCCCLWVIAGGMLATYLRQQDTPYQIPAAEGALMGLAAGAIGAIIGGLLSIPLEFALGPMQQQIIERFAQNPELPPELRDALGSASVRTGAAWRVAAIMISVVVYSIFGLLGGLLGTAVFKKNAPPPPPPGTVEILPPE
jgi:hypothetical protein